MEQLTKFKNRIVERINESWVLDSPKAAMDAEKEVIDLFTELEKEVREAKKKEEEERNKSQRRVHPNALRNAELLKSIAPIKL